MSPALPSVSVREAEALMKVIVHLGVTLCRLADYFMLWSVVCSLLCPEEYLSNCLQADKKKRRKQHTVFCLDLNTALYWCSMVSTLVTVTVR